MKMDKDMGSILGPELKIDGNVSVDGSLLIYGTVNGNIESQGSVRTAKGSKVKGDIIGSEAHICGLVEGNLIIDGKIILGSESQLKGNLKSGTLIIEEGAKFAGTCDMAQYETDGAHLDE
jgi:cytoskeletal protein CcmA (bactofilin family)|tara:strand:- start:689 stop:1048 length:360 start_codon:yes stop_codon:yes gene_type:complete